MSGKPLPRAAAGQNGLPKQRAGLTSIDNPRRPNTPSNVFASLKATQILTLKPVLPAGQSSRKNIHPATFTMLTTVRTHRYHPRLPSRVRLDNMRQSIQAFARDGL